jgi:tetratricopeptide (TPR) repeat protein
MEIRDFYEHLLGLASPWTVNKVVSEGKPERVDVYLECAETAQLQCPRCDLYLSTCDNSPLKTWRHLDTCGKMTYLHARLPVVECPEHGRQCPHPPWGRTGSPVTLQLEQWIAGLVKGFGDIKKAARFIRMDQAHIRHILRRTTEETGAVSGKGRSTEEHDGPLQTSPTSPARQLSIFDQNDMTFVNQGIRAFRSLELEKAVELFQRHRSVYPKGYNVTSRLAAAEFLLRGIREAPAESSSRTAHLCRLWDSFEDHAGSEAAGRDTLAGEIERAFFARVMDEAERISPSGSEPISLYEDIPLGYILLRAGRLEEAIRSLQGTIPEMPHKAALYGYLGDAYLLRGDAKVARQCYREACLIDPAGIDWRHLRDEALKELKQDLLLGYGMDLDLALEWLPSHARIDGLFERKVVRLHDGMKELVDEYLALEKASSKDKSPRLAAKLFFRGMILCENQENLKFIKTIDLIEVRRKMKQANPGLFAEFVERIVEGKSPG